MAWRDLYLDIILVPLALFSSVLYHSWLWYVVRTRPNRTSIGVSSHGQRVWVSAMLKDNDKKNILAVQTLRNYIMGSTLVATTSILVGCALLAFDSRTSVSNKTHISSLFGGHGELDVAYKFAVLLIAFLAAFLCLSLSIGFLNQVGVLINIVTTTDARSSVTSERVSKLLEKGFLLGTVGNRLFYATLPLTLWIFGPIIVFICSIGMIPMFYRLDIVGEEEKGNARANVATIRDSDIVVPFSIYDSNSGLRLMYLSP